MNRKKGIEFTNGSLGMGLSLGIGVALAVEKKKIDYRVYILMGDGECNEGSVWEAAMSAAHYKLDNIIAILDHNKFQQTGSNNDIMSVGDLANKWNSFGWHVIEIDGHNISEIYQALLNTEDLSGPCAIIAHTVKGKGFSFSENDNNWHHAPLSSSQYEKALEYAEKYLEKCPTEAKSYHEIADIHFTFGNYILSKEYYEKAFMIDSDNPNYMIGMAKSDLNLYNYSDAQDQLEEALSLCKGPRDYYNVHEAYVEFSL